jgi:hypothetical protein
VGAIPIATKFSIDSRPALEPTVSELYLGIDYPEAILPADRALLVSSRTTVRALGAKSAVPPWAVVAVAGVVVLIELGSAAGVGVVSSSSVSMPRTAGPGLPTASNSDGAGSAELLAAQTALIARGSGQELVAGPSPRFDSAIAYDVKDGYVLMFGGQGLNDTWSFSGGTWSKVSTARSPPAGYGLSMAYDAKDGYVLLFDLDQTWKYLAGVWTPLSTLHTPPERLGATMAYDPKDGYMLLFGGVNSSGSYLRDSWKYVAGNWTRITGATRPSSRAFASMTYDMADGYIVLYGGCDGKSGACTTKDLLSDTWKFANGVWTKLTPAKSPPARDLAMMVYDAGDGYVLLYGGQGASGLLSSSWKFSGGGWAQLSPPHSPGQRFGGSMSYDSKDGYVVLFGGVNATGALLGDSWRYEAGQWTKISKESPPLTSVASLSVNAGSLGGGTRSPA